MFNREKREQRRAIRAERKAERKRLHVQRRRLRVHRRSLRQIARQEKRAVWLKAHKRGLHRARRISYHLLSVSIVAGIFLLGMFRAPESFLRFWEALRDLFGSITGSPTVTQLPENMVEGFPRAVEEFGEIAKTFGKLFLSRPNFLAYLELLWKIFSDFSYALLWAMFPLLALVLFGLISFQKTNRRHGAKTKPLKAFLAVRQHVFLPVGRYLRGFAKFFRSRRKYFLTGILIALFYLNVYTVVLEALAYYIFFLFAEDLSLGFGVQLVKLAYDVFLAFRFLPVWVWAIVGLKLFDLFRKDIGYRLLEKYENDLRKFLEERGVNILVCGPPRTGKTTTLVSFVKSLAAVAYRNAKAGMRDIEQKFPDFPWSVLEQMIRKDYGRRRFRNLYHLRQWTDEMIEKAKTGGKRWLRTLRKHYRSCCAVRFDYPLFNYDTGHFRTTYKSALGIDTIEECISDYAQLYLIYIQPMLILSNFSIRSDDDWIDLGNFPEWRDDFFRHDPDPLGASKFSKILNQDLIRPGKQVDPKCKYKDCFEFGILAETEVGKERGNQFSHSGKSATSAEANVLNDQRDNLFKLMGHLGTVYNIPFARYVGDEQRPGSWGANGKELCDIITIRERCRDKIVMPFFAFEELLYVLTVKLFGEYYYDPIRMRRGDTSLLTYLLAHLCGKIFAHYRYIRDKFGGHFNKVNVEQAMKQDGDNEALTKSKLFIANAKVYAKAFRTAGWKPFMEQRAANCGEGLEDVPSYHGLDPFLDEFLEQRSYFFTELLKNFSGQEQERALDLIVRTLTQFYHDAEEQFDKKTAQGLLEELTESLPKITENDNFAEMKQKLAKKRETLITGAKKKWDEEQAKKRNGEAVKGKNQAETAVAAES